MQALRDDIEGMKARFTAMEEDVALVKRASANVGAVEGTSVGKVEFPKPNRFNGSRDAKEVENFLWQMEIYFDNLNLVAENAKVKAATSYLSDTAMLWWRRKHSEIEQGTCRIDPANQLPCALRVYSPVDSHTCQTPWSVFQDGSNGEPTGRRPEHADAEARREARAADHD